MRTPVNNSNTTLWENGIIMRNNTINTTENAKFKTNQDAMTQLRGVTSCRAEGVARSGDSIETLQSRSRELEKKVRFEKKKYVAYGICVCF